MKKEVLSPSTVWDPGAQLLSQAILVEDAKRTVYLSGQTSIGSDGSIAGIGDPASQIRKAFENIELILLSAGAALPDVVKLTVYFADIGHLDLYTAILGELFPETRPAQTVVEVSRLAIGELLVEIDAVAHF